MHPQTTIGTFLSRAVRAALATIVLTACGGGDGPTGNQQVTNPLDTASLRTAVRLRSLQVGVGTAVGQYFNRTDANGTKYMQMLAREFDVLTPENDMKFGPLRPSRDVFRFTRADSMVQFAQANGMKVRGHALVWHQQNPAWLTGGSWTKAQAVALLDEHITTVVGHYRGKLAAWDVVNEAVADNGTMRSTFWSQAIGPEYIEQAFRTADAADAGVLLFYNDYGIEWPGAKQDAAYALLADLKARGVPVDGVGFQMHMEVGVMPSKESLKQTFARFAALGLEIHLTELDVRMTVPSTATSRQTQAQNYRDIYAACLETPACKMIVTWGFTDLDSWVPGTFAGKGEALLFDAAFQPKPAYTSVRNLLAGR